MRWSLTILQQCFGLIITIFSRLSASLIIIICRFLVPLYPSIPVLKYCTTLVYLICFLKILIIGNTYFCIKNFISVLSLPLFLTKESLKSCELLIQFFVSAKRCLSLNFFLKSLISFFISGIYDFGDGENFRPLLKSFIWLVDKGIPGKVNISWCKIKRCSSCL